MKARVAAAPEKTDSSRRFRYLLYGVAGIILIVCGSVSLAGLVLVQKLKGLEEVISRAETEYAALNAAYPFAPPGPGEPVPSELIAAFQEVHASFIEDVPTEKRSYSRTLLEVKQRKNGQLLLLLKTGFREYVGELLDAHVEALKRTQLSPEAFLWVHGLYMQGQFHAPEGREYYSRLMDRIGASALEKASAGPELAQYDRLLSTRYAPYNGVEVNQRVPESALEGLVDLLMLNYALRGPGDDSQA